MPVTSSVTSVLGSYIFDLTTAIYSIDAANNYIMIDGCYTSYDLSTKTGLVMVGMVKN